MDDNDKRFAPPRAALADLPAPLESGAHVYGGRWRRFFAATVDAVFNGAIYFTLLLGNIGFDGYVAMIMRAAAEGGSKFEMYRTMFQSTWPGYVVILLVDGWLLYAFGQSLGKKALGLRVVRMDGSRVDFARLFFLRGGCANLVNFIPAAGPLLALVDVCMIFRDSRQALHDQIADTVVVTAASSPTATLAGQRAARLAA